MKKHISVGLIGLMLVSGCTSFRGIPSHGGGKRFDEEQRLIAASIYKALEQMQCDELRGKKVRVVHEFTTTYGSGNASFGGLQDITLLPSYSYSDADYDG
ncbi:hypothetical protein [Tichowtungia aerotolerans]|uniref:Lipoprotein n=1 Tax=Tichowtungia aerotolerans TaxID=2697043 RepID=A0A6P1MHW7_9BACT|nr:hypothetical protein [Tichowtungia aerotolerans]QHI70645.1 hypothetical protein GT409_14745 [Tichowtungia aerotolerans]